MKYIIILLFTSLQLLAQQRYENIRSKVETTIEKTKKQNIYLNTIISNFNQSGKIKLEGLKKDDVGICIVLSEENQNLSVSPAKYTFDNEKINITAVGIENNSKLSNDLKEYIDKYLTQFENLGSTKLFQQLIYAKIAAQGVYSENKTEYVVNEPNTVSFIRGNEDWMYIISIDEQYENLNHPRIIVYCFKKSFSGPDIFNLNNSLEDAEKNTRYTTTIE